MSITGASSSQMAYLHCAPFNWATYCKVAFTRVLERHGQLSFSSCGQVYSFAVSHPSSMVRCLSLHHSGIPPVAENTTTAPRTRRVHCRPHTLTIVTTVLPYAIRRGIHHLITSLNFHHSRYPNPHMPMSSPRHHHIPNLWLTALRRQFRRRTLSGSWSTMLGVQRLRESVRDRWASCLADHPVRQDYRSW